MTNNLDLHTIRAQKARLGRTVGNTGYTVLLSAAMLSLLGAGAFWYTDAKTLAFMFAALAIAVTMPALWWQHDLRDVAVQGNDFMDRIDGKTLGLLSPKQPLTGSSLWTASAESFQTSFVLNRLLLPRELVTQAIEHAAMQPAAILAAAAQIADENNSARIEPGFITLALITGTPEIMQYLTSLKLNDKDVREVGNWLYRELQAMRRPRPSFGGIGRDWAFGFTPVLDRFGENLSLSIAKYRIDFGARGDAPEVIAIENAFANRVNGIALIGPAGVGKSSAVHALAQKLIEGDGPSALAYHQVIGLSPSTILSNAQNRSDLERIMVMIANEVAHAGHVVLFLDDAALFTQEGAGAFNATKLLQQLIQNGSVPVIMAMSPSDFQRLKSAEPGLANLLTPIFLQEPTDAIGKRIVMDNVLRLEGRQKAVISYPALLEAYRLSGRYNQDEAYPGKAIKLLEQTVGTVGSDFILPEAVQAAVEQTYGVKASTASPAEANTLLHLEDRIHEHMIDQVYAVKAVSGALRRSRAGIANPKRPIGSFLFLGPTGVGKTELAKAVATVYFNAESNLIRLDMSEYQQPDDVQRLLSANSGLIMNVRQTPFSVVLLDEIEKAHPNVLNLLLQLLDEGNLTDTEGRKVSFKDCIIIATSNAGATSIRERVASGSSLESFRDTFIDELISSNQFKPELLNRFDELVLFGPLDTQALLQVVALMIDDINRTLAPQDLTLQLTPAAMEQIVAKGYDARLGARPMRRALQQAVEDPISQKILQGQTKPGDTLLLDVKDLAL